MAIVPKLMLTRHFNIVEDLSLVDAENIRLYDDKSCLVNDYEVKKTKITDLLYKYYSAFGAGCMTEYYQNAEYENEFDYENDGYENFNEFDIIKIIPCNTELVIIAKRHIAKFIEDSSGEKYYKCQIFRYLEEDDQLVYFYESEFKNYYDDNNNLTLSGFFQNNYFKWHGGNISFTFTYTSSNCLILAIGEWFEDNDENYQNIALISINIGTIGLNKNYDINLDKNYDFDEECDISKIYKYVIDDSITNDKNVIYEYLSIAPKLQIPNIDDYEYVNGSSYKGWYYFYIRYKLNNVDYTPWYNIGHPIYLDELHEQTIIKYGNGLTRSDADINEDIKNNYENKSIKSTVKYTLGGYSYSLDCGDYFSTKDDICFKSIKFTFNDTNVYKYYQIGVIISNKSYTKSYILKEDKTLLNNNEVTFFIEDFVEESINNLTNPAINYYNVKNIINKNNMLLISNYKELESNNNINLNNVYIKPDYESINIKKIINLKYINSIDIGNSIEKFIEFKNLYVYINNDENVYRLPHIIKIIKFTDFYDGLSKNTDYYVKPYGYPNSNPSKANLDDLYVLFDSAPPKLELAFTNVGSIRLLHHTNLYTNDNGDYMCTVSHIGSLNIYNAVFYVKNDDSINSTISNVPIFDISECDSPGAVNVLNHNNFYERCKHNTLLPNKSYNFYLHLLNIYGEYTKGYDIIDNNININTKDYLFYDSIDFKPIDHYYIINNDYFIKLDNSEDYFIYSIAHGIDRNCISDLYKRYNQLLSLNDSTHLDRVSKISNKYNEYDAKDRLYYSTDDYISYTTHMHSCINGLLDNKFCCIALCEFFKNIIDILVKYRNNNIDILNYPIDKALWCKYDYLYTYSTSNEANCIKFTVDDQEYVLKIDEIRFTNRFMDFMRTSTIDENTDPYLFYEEINNIGSFNYGNNTKLQPFCYFYYTQNKTLNNKNLRNNDESGTNDGTNVMFMLNKILGYLFSIYLSNFFSYFTETKDIDNIKHILFKFTNEGLKTPMIMPENETINIKVNYPDNYFITYQKMNNIDTNLYGVIPINTIFNVINDKLYTAKCFSDIFDISDSLRLQYTNAMYVCGQIIPQMFLGQPVSIKYPNPENNEETVTIEAGSPHEKYTVNEHNTIDLTVSSLSYNQNLIFDKNYFEKIVDIENINLLINNDNNNIGRSTSLQINEFGDTDNVYPIMLFNSFNNYNKELIRYSDYIYNDIDKNIKNKYNANGYFTYPGVLIFNIDGTTYNSTNNTYDQRIPFKYLQYCIIDDYFHEAKCFNKTPDVVVKYEGGYMKNYILNIVTVQDSIDLFENRSAPSSQFNLNIYDKYDKNKNNKTEFNKTIRLSNAIKDESDENEWKKISLEKYKNITENKGVITNIVNTGTITLIHTEHSLFIINADETLKLSNKDIQLAERDFIELSYKEMFSSILGYGGLQDKYAWILGEFGYIYYDNDSKHIYRIDGNNSFIDIGESIQLILNTLDINTIRFADDIKNNRIFIKINYNYKKNIGLNPNRPQYVTVIENIILSYNYKLNAFISLHKFNFIHDEQNIWDYFDDCINTKNILYFICKDTKTDNKYLFTFDNNKFVNNFKLSFIGNANYDKIKSLECINYEIGFGNNTNNYKISPEQDNYSYSGNNLVVYNDFNKTTIDLYNIKKDKTHITLGSNSINKIDEYNKPYYQLGKWNISYLRNVINNGLNRFFGNYFIFDFTFNENSKNIINNQLIEFRSFNYNVSYEYDQ